MMTSREIYEVLRANRIEYRTFGIYTCDNDWSANIDDALSTFADPISATGFIDYLWLFDKPSDKDLAKDLAAIEKALATNASNQGRHIYLVACDDYCSWRNGRDVVMNDAKVLAAIK